MWKFIIRHRTILIGGITGCGIVLGLTYDANTTGAVLSSSVRGATPLILGALCGMLGERSGVINIGIEGQMLFGAFVGFWVNAIYGTLYCAVISAILAGMVLGAFLAMMAVSLRMDQIIAGTVINILIFGLTGYLYQTDLNAGAKLPPFTIGFLKEVPIIGALMSRIPIITALTLCLVFMTHLLIFHTKWGLRSRAVGEQPNAADSLGISVIQIRYVNLILGGALAGLAGAFLTLEAVGTFERGMTNGRGFVALAVLIFGKWRPLGILAGALLFGFAGSLQTQLQFHGWMTIPHQFIGMLPYALTLVVLVGFIGRMQPPAALGAPFERR